MYNNWEIVKTAHPVIRKETISVLVLFFAPSPHQQVFSNNTPCPLLSLKQLSTYIQYIGALKGIRSVQQEVMSDRVD